MSIVKYLCEFFFCDFWHFLELFIIVGLVSQKVKIIKIHKDKE